MEILLTILALIVVLVIVLVVRTLNFKPEELNQVSKKHEYDYEAAYLRLQQLIQIPTISNRDWDKVDQSQFDKIQKLIEKNYPTLHKNGDKKIIGRNGLLYKYAGKNSANPTVLMAHYDVVPVGDESEWINPPFSGLIKDNELWGRGTLDTKTTFFSALESVEYHMNNGFVPENDIYLAFGGNEEVAGEDAPKIVQWFKDNNITPKLVVDEGGAIVENLFPGVKEQIAVIGVGEKGIMDVGFRVESTGGHASTPPKHTAVGLMAQAINRAENAPFKCDLSEPLLGLIDNVGRYSTFGLKLVFANLWLFKPILIQVFKKMGGEVDAMMHTTQAFTMFNAGTQSNVLPPYATAVANFRIEKKDTVQDVLNHLKTAINNDAVKMEVITANEATSYSSINNEYYGRVKQAINDTWPNTIVSPYLMVAASDSRHYDGLCDVVLRFSAMKLSKEQRGMIHNYNERIELHMIDEAIEFYLNLVEKS